MLTPRSVRGRQRSGSSQYSRPSHGIAAILDRVGVAFGSYLDPAASITNNNDTLRNLRRQDDSTAIDADFSGVCRQYELTGGNTESRNRCPDGWRSAQHHHPRFAIDGCGRANGTCRDNGTQRYAVARAELNPGKNWRSAA
jgi:hypothetical protein